MAEPLQVFLLPDRQRLNGQSPSAACAKWLSRMNQCQGIAGETAQLQRHFECIPSQWAMAAVCRQAEFGDASESLWLRADPVHLQVEMRGARIMAWDTLKLTELESLAIESSLRPIFGDAGYGFERSSDGFFYIKIARGTPLPDFLPAPEALGADLFSILPNDKKWTALFNECQITLHNLPINVERIRKGQLAINGLWFWGQGSLPLQLKHPYLKIASYAWDLKALAAFPHETHTVERKSALLDCRQIRRWSEVEAKLSLKESFHLDFSDGTILSWRPQFKWYFWRNRSIGFS
jgi:hypothetical protein